MSSTFETLSQPVTSPARRQPDLGFSVREARDICQDLFQPSAAVYWTDFLLSVGFGWLCFNRLRWSTSLTVQVFAYIGAVLLFYRAGSFTHELVHLRTGTYKAFHIVWNLFCGIPLMMPSFMYATHIAHHARNHYGTAEDGEYLPLAHGNVFGIVVYLGQAFVLPLLAIVRFLILTPAAWVCPPLRRIVQQRASSMVMDPRYIRPLPSDAEMRVWRVQEAACFVLSALVATLLSLGIIEISALFKVYAISVGVLLLNELRTLGAHRFRYDGSREVAFVEQLLDSVNYPERPWLTELWAPVGLRFHALHHLFPSMPYHNLPAAHARLMAKLPADSPYRKTVSPSLLQTLGDLIREIRSNATSGSIEKAAA